MTKTQVTEEAVNELFRLCVDNIYKNNERNLRCRSGYMMQDGSFIGAEGNTEGWIRVEFAKEFSRCVRWVYEA